jgi:hypothetical protein
MVGVTDGDKEGVRVGVGEGVRDGVREGVTNGVRVGVRVGVEEGVTDGVGVAVLLFVCCTTIVSLASWMVVPRRICTKTVRSPFPVASRPGGIGGIWLPFPSS